MNEHPGFTRDKNEKNFMRVGLRNKLEDWLNKYEIPFKAKDIHSEEVDGKVVFYVDIEGDVILNDFHINDVPGKIPEYLKFRNVTGKFILGNH